MKKTAMNFLLFLGGAIMAYEFYIILIQGKIYPVPNVFALAVYSLLILGTMIFALWDALRVESVREGLPGAALFSMGFGLLVANVILPIIFLTYGNPINYYYGHEPDTVIALGELSLAAAVGLYGLFELFKRLTRTKNPV